MNICVDNLFTTRGGLKGAYHDISEPEAALPDRFRDGLGEGALAEVNVKVGRGSYGKRV